MRLSLSVVLLLSACATAQNIPPSGAYVPQMGNFQCQGYPLGAEVTEALGPHGGTIRIKDIAREIRFDLEELEPPLNQSALETMRNKLYEGYLTQNIVPLLRNVSSQVQVIEAKATVLEKPNSFVGLPVYKSAVLMREKSLVRGQVQYSDGRFMYTMSTLATAKPNWTKDEQLKAAYEQLLIGLSWCHFPSPKTH